MAKTDPYERRHQANLRRYGQIIDEIFREAVNEAVRLSENADFDSTRAFSFDDYPILKQRLQELLSRLKNSLLTAIVNGVNSEWTLSNNKNNELSRRVFGDNIGRLTQEQYRRYFTNNDTAREAFLKRKEAGLDLSERVWKYAEQFKEDIELGLDVGIRDGLDAPSMSRELQQYLRRPDMLFRRVRDEHGTLHLSKRASEYHPGQGVYRSSYKNARRLAVTETNMAYRNADHERWQDMDFVVGIEIKLSNNHTCLGKDGKAHEFHDICDELQGKYPKDFKFTGWHPHCRCHAVSILMTDEEIRAGNRAILRGEEPPTESVNTVKDVPDNFKKWIAGNGGRIERAKSLPHFLRDNGKYWNEEQYRGLESAKLGRKAAKEAYVEYENSTPIAMSKEVEKNVFEAASKIGVKVTPMTFLEADSGKANDDFLKDDMFRQNCQCCVVVHEARLRGLDITSLPYSYDINSIQYKLGDKFQMAWINPKNGKTPEVTVVKGDSDAVIMSKLGDATKSIGRYHIGLNTKGGIGHVIVAERMQSGKIIYYDAQSGNFININEYEELEKIEVLKVDRLIFDVEILKDISRPV